MGLLKVGPEGGLATPLVTEAEGVPLGFTNDLDIDDDGTVYFTDSSISYQRRSASLDSFLTILILIKKCGGLVVIFFFL